MLKRKRTYV
jgi:hypothetical protein